tara:strand:+ start:17988 stop:22604 length:4617 start_codon:yes stop_codon:yes gene_type:complete
MTDIVKNISQLVESQFPQVYRQDGPELIAFIEAYYEFLESSGQATKLSREMFDANDIDKTLDDFIVHFKEKYLKDFPFIASTDKRFLVKNILDLYSSKGSESSIKLLMRMLFGENVDVYYPGQDIFKPSDSTWLLPKYIELSESVRTAGFVNKQITGGISSATAFVESIVKKRIDGRIIDVLYLSSINGQFQYGEFITDNGDLTNSPKITGSMTNISITNGGQNNSIGDIFEVQSQGGRQGTVRVTGVSNETGRVNFELVDGGAGYTLNSQAAIDAGHENFLSTSTNVYVSDSVLTLKNVKYSRQDIYNELLYLETIYTNNQDTIDGFDDTSSDYHMVLSEFYLAFGPSSADKKDIFQFLISVYYNSVDNENYIRYDFDEQGSIHSPGEAIHLSGVLDGTWDSILKDYLLDYSFIDFEKVIQPMETITVTSAETIKDNAKVGDYIFGYDGGAYSSTPGTELSKGVILSFNDNVENSDNLDVIVQCETGTFLQQSYIEAGVSDFTDDNVGEILEEESSATISVEMTTGTFSQGDTIYQYVIDYQSESAGTIDSGTTYTIMSVGNTNFTAVGASVNVVGTSFTADSTFDAEGIGAGTGTIRSAETPYRTISYGEGYIDTLTNTGGSNYTFGLTKVYGTFEFSISDNTYLVQNAAETVISASRSFTMDEQGARGKITDVETNVAYTNFYVDTIFGLFSSSKEVRGNKSFYKASVTSVSDGQGVSDVYLNNVVGQVGILNSASDTSAIGYVTGQNTTSVGLHSIDGTFLSSELVYRFSAYEIALQVIRRVVGLTTPSESRYQTLWEDIISIEENNPYDWGLSDVLDLLKFHIFGRVSNNTAMQLLGQYATDKFFIKTVREELISPPRDSNGTIIELDKVFIDNVSEGQDAAFEPGSLENEEDIFLYTDLLGDENVNGVRFTDIEMTGEGAGIGFLDSIDVIHYELKGYDGSTANRNIYIVDVVEDVSTLFTDGDGLTLTRIDGSTVTGSIEVLDSAWVQYDVTDDTTSTLNKIIVSVDASVTTLLPCETLTGPGPDNNVTGIIKVSPIENIILKNSTIVQGDYSSVAPTSATMDFTDLGSDMYSSVVEWVSDNTNSRVYVKLDGDLFDSANTFSSSEFYAKVLINVDNLVYLRLGVLDVVDTRVGSQPSQSITLDGGGFAGGDPVQAAQALLDYDVVSGYVVDTTVTDPGSNYYSYPNIPSSYAWTTDNWTGVQGGLPLLSINVDFGYGFGLRPHGDQGTPLEDILRSGTFTIGTITSLTNINPGQLYNADPFINVINPYIAAFKKANYVFKIELLSDNPFLVGETVTQTVSNIQSSKGNVISSRSDELSIERTNFAMTITDGVEIVGGTSGARAQVTSVINTDIDYWGTNANVTGDVVVATGVATDIEVVSSGFGYNQDEAVTMVSANDTNDFVITGQTQLVNQGTGSGFWRTFNSHLNYDKKIRDNDFYQEFSYQVLSGQSINRYERILKDTLHVAGTKMFGGVVYESAVSGSAEVEAKVDQVALIEYQLGDLTNSIEGIVSQDGQPILVTKEIIREVEE